MSATTENRNREEMSQNSTTKKLLDKLVERKVEFNRKYLMVDMLKLLRENCQNDEDIKRLVEGMEVLSKYCENLITPQSLRPQKWPVISLHNRIFMAKVQPINGHQEILKKIGYTQASGSNLLYDAEGSVGDSIAAQIYLELKAIQSELKLWVEKRHPHPELFHGILKPNDSTEPRHLLESKAGKDAAVVAVKNSTGGDPCQNVSPNTTLTPENAKYFGSHMIRRQQQREEAEPRAAPRTFVIKRPKSSQFEVDAIDPLVMKRVTNDNRSWTPGMPKIHLESFQSPRKSFSSLEQILLPVPAPEKWNCEHCTFENEHSDKTCRKSGQSGASNHRPPLSSWHTCDMCCKTTLVPCSLEFSQKRADQFSMPEVMVRKDVQKLNAGGESKNDTNMDYNTAIEMLQKQKAEGTKLLWNNRLQNFIKILHAEFGQVPEEEILFLFSILESKLLSAPVLQDFKTSAEEVLDYWKCLLETTVGKLKKRQVFIERFPENEPKHLIKGSLIRCGGNIEEAVARFMKSWNKLMATLKEECSISDLTQSDYSNTLYQCEGDVEEAKICLVKNRYFYGVWGQENFNQEAAADLYRDTRLFDQNINRALKDKNIPYEKRVRMLMCEFDIGDPKLANQVMGLMDSSDDSKDLYIADFLEALEMNTSLGEAKKHLNRECLICCESRPSRSFMKHPRCNCEVCQHCIRDHYTIRIKEQSIASLVCPLCNEPDIDKNFVDYDYFRYLIKQLKNIIDDKLINSLGENLTKWSIKNERVTHCPWDCGEQFIIDEIFVRVAICPNCNGSMCTNCLDKWVKGHSCEDSIRNNSPITSDLRKCPECQQVFWLVKGGCLHLKCKTCSHEFCSECSEPFKHNDCQLNSYCSISGLHCHHLRDCFYFLRDKSIQDLQRLLETHKIHLGKSASASNQDQSLPLSERSTSAESSLTRSHSSLTCLTVVQKSDVGKEESCGIPSYCEELGLCGAHYKEYLYMEIKNCMIDPVYIMDEGEILILLKRYNIRSPEKDSVQTSYKKHLIDIVKKQLPLKRTNLTPNTLPGVEAAADANSRSLRGTGSTNTHSNIQLQPRSINTFPNRTMWPHVVEEDLPLGHLMPRGSVSTNFDSLNPQEDSPPPADDKLYFPLGTEDFSFGDDHAGPWDESVGE